LRKEERKENMKNGQKKRETEGNKNERINGKIVPMCAVKAYGE
jgi:hypothetical protein